MRAALPLLAAILLLAGCGGGADGPTVPGAPAGAKVQSRDLGGGWSVAWTVVGGKGYAAVFHDGKPAKGVRVTPIGPDPGESVGRIPQVAAGMKASAAIVDYSLFVDDQALDAKGGGLRPQDVTIYGAPASSLSPGPHVALAVARAGDSAGAAVWPFTVR